MTLQGQQGRVTHADELAQRSLTYPFPLPQREDARTDMLPWGQVASSNVETKRMEHGPQRGEIPLPVFQQAQGRQRHLRLLRKIALGQFSLFPFSLQVHSQRRMMTRKFEHSGVRERQKRKKVCADSSLYRSGEVQT